MNIEKLVKDLWWSLTAFNTIDKLPDALIFTNSEGNIEHYNKKAQKTFNLVYDELKPININSLLTNGLQNIQQSIEMAKPVLTSATVNGKEFYVELNAVRKNNGYSISVRDLTKLTKEIVNDEKTLLFNNEKNAMIAKLEGDIKSPITSISGFSQGLMDGLGGVLTEKQAKYVKIINNNAEELHKFMEKFIEFSKAESSIYEPDLRNIDVIETIKNIELEFDKELAEKKLTFDIDYEQIEKRTIFIDCTALKSALKNIIETSIEMTDSGFVSIRLSHPNEQTCEIYNLTSDNRKYLQIQIRDTGIGFAEDEVKYLCAPYAQLEKGKKNIQRSLALGSAVIFIKRINGYMNIISEQMKGTEYSIIIPIEKD